MEGKLYPDRGEFKVQKHDPTNESSRALPNYCIDWAMEASLFGLTAAISPETWFEADEALANYLHVAFNALTLQMLCEGLLACAARYKRGYALLHKLWSRQH